MLQVAGIHPGQKGHGGDENCRGQDDIQAELTGHHHGGGADEKPKGEGEQFSRIFNITAGVGA